MTDFDWNGKNVLVTGAGGFIGSAVAKALRLAGANVIALVQNVTGTGVQSDLYEMGCVIEFGDVCDYERMRNIISLHEVEYVYHLAAYSIVRVSAKDPLSTYRTNVMGTVSVLEACRNVGNVKGIVVSSSDKAYGDHDELPYLETHPLKPKNTYDTSKACTDMIARSFSHNYGMPILVSRCSNVYGPGDMNLSRIIPNTIRRVISGKRPIVYSDIESMEREFIYIDDVVSAYLALGQLARFDRADAYNIGGNGPVKILDLVKQVCELAGRPDVEPEIVPRDPTFKEISRQYIDAEKLTSTTGWLPQTSLAEGLTKTIEWYRGKL